MVKTKNGVGKLLVLLVMQLLIIGLFTISFAAEAKVFTAGSEDSAVEKDTLEKAIADATEGQTVQLVNNVEIESLISITKKITVDLNGKAITREATKDGSCIFKIESNGNLTIVDNSGDNTGKLEITGNFDTKCIHNEGTLTIEAGTYEARTGVFVYGASTTTINGGTFNAKSFPVATNGTDTDTTKTITITDGVFSGCIYLPAPGTYNIKGGTFTAKSDDCALVIRQGTLNITGGDFTSNVKTDQNKDTSVNTGTNGSYLGAIVVAKNSGYKNAKLEVNLAGGTFTNSQGDAVVLANELDDATDTSRATLTISDKAKVNGNVSNYSKQANNSSLKISGGTITELNPVAENSKGQFRDLQTAINYADENDTVKLLKSQEISTTVNINKSITLDLDKNTITLNSSDNPLGIKITKSATLTNGTITSSMTATSGTAVMISGEGTEVNFKQMKITASEGNAVTLYEYPDSNSSVTINIDEDSEIVSENKAAIVVFGSKKTAKYEINVNGTVTAKSTYSAINGSWDNPGTVDINLNSATISGGILQMCKGNIKVTGNTSINGSTGIVITDGTLLVEEGAKINGTGEWQEYKSSANQEVFDNGAAIYIEPDTDVQVTINGGTFVSEKSAAISAPGPNNLKLTLSITNGEFTGSSTTVETQEAVYVKDKTEFISGGYYSSDPSKYVITEKAAVSSDKPGFLYMIGEKEVDLNVEVEVKEPQLNKAEGVEIQLDESNFEADENVLGPIASSLANDPKVINQKEDEIEQELKDAGVATEESTVTVVVEPYLEIEVKAYDKEARILTLDVEAVYDLIATTAKKPEDIDLVGSDGEKNAVRIGGGTIEVKTPIDLTFALPTELQNENTLYVHHTTKSGKTYVYNTEKGNGTITFTNPHGFSTFVVKNEDGVAKIEDTKYATLEEAVDEVENNGTITLQKDCNENITVSKEITFTLDKSNSNYTGTISAGSGYQVEKTENDNKITYKFTKIPSSSGSSGSSHSSGGGSSSKSYTIEVTVGKNGTVTPDGKVRVTQGKDRVFKINPDEGYEIDEILVDGKNVKVENTYTFENVKADHTLEVSFKKVEEKQEENKNLYDDVLGTEWYADAVEFVTENDLMNGTGNNKFSPNTTLTRGMLVTILYRLSNANTEVTSTFSDVPTTSYYSNAIAWASENKIVNGIGNNLFAPDRGVTREEMATIFDRYITAMNISIDDILDSQTYADESDIANFASTAVDKMTTTGLMQGTGDNNFSPKGLATRAQTATIIMRFAERTNAI